MARPELNLLLGKWNREAIDADPRGWINAMSCYAEDMDGGEQNLLRFMDSSPAPSPDRLFRPLPAITTIYFMGSEGGPIKIGMAERVNVRLRSLQLGSPIPLRLLASLQGPPSVERDYHKRFAEHRLHGEWFSPHPDILAEVERLNRPTPTGEAG